MTTTERFCLPLDMDFSDLLFLLRGFGGLFEGGACSVRREQAGSCVLVSLMSAARVSTSFSSIILFLRHSFSSWLRLKATQFTLSASPLPNLCSQRLFVMRLTQISIFLSIYALMRLSISLSSSPSSSSSSSDWGGCGGGAKVAVVLSCCTILSSSLNCLLSSQNSFILATACAQLVAHGEVMSSVSFCFSYCSSLVYVYRCTKRTTLMRLVNLTSIPSTRSDSLPTVAGKEFPQF